MSNVYWLEHAMREDVKIPSILAIGDSWFWYPFPGGSLLSHLGPVVARKEHTIFAIGNNGAEAIEYASGKYRKMVKHALNLYGDGLSAVFVSGGGNDFAGVNDLLPLLHGDNSQAQTAEQCFLPGRDWPSVGWLLDQMRDSLSVLFARILDACPKARIFVHDYDYAYPDGRGALGYGGWIKPALVRTNTPEHLHRPCVTHIIDRFAEMQQSLAANNPDHIVVVDARGTLQYSDWANEMHPTGAGFRKHAQVWKAVLERYNLA